MAMSMAAAIAASLPAPQAAPAPAAPIYQTIPPSMAKIIDVEAEIPLTSVQLDGLAVTKIIKHSTESQPSQALGLLLGIDFDGVLEISNCFPLPHKNDDDEKANKSISWYQTAMVRALTEVQGDDSIVGFYQSTTLGAFFSQTLVELQVIHQEKLRRGGLAIVHDVTQAARGNANFHAFRLKKNFLDAHKKGRFNSQVLINHELTFSSILEEIPLTVRTNQLMSALLKTLSTTPSFSAVAASSPSELPSPVLGPSFTSLDLMATRQTQNLERILDGLDEYKTEEGNLAYLSRQIARERAKAEGYIAKRREENAARVEQGLAPLPEEDVNRMFKIPPEPNRLESMLLLGQIDAYAKSTLGAASSRLVKMYGANAGAAS